MKLKTQPAIGRRFLVAPFAGAWIETAVRALLWLRPSVAPFAGAWIETRRAVTVAGSSRVAPFAGAWIETPEYYQSSNHNNRRPLRGGVD